MHGRLSSLNVSVAGGILLYEVVRQLHTQSRVDTSR
jgi:tRNA G18 (ribose-2'-O)-methylase SpoU